MRFEFVVDHLMYLFLEKGSLFLVKGRVLFEGSAERVLGHLKVAFDHDERVLQNVFEYLHFLFDGEQLLLGVGVGCTGC